MRNFTMACISLLLVLFMAVDAHAKEKVSGKVADANGNPLTGVAVLLDGSNSVGTVTNGLGEFTLTIPNKHSSLTASLLGYVSQTLSANGILNFVLNDDVLAIADVVVVGYGTQRKENLTGAVAQVSSKVLENRPLSNVGAALQGAIGNLNITTGGRPGEASDFNVRGFGSINSKAKPLILIDNVTTTQEELARLNPSDIESISVLKDASSAAIYGARAAFGVVLITTKSGKSDDLKISVNYNQSFSRSTRLPKYVYDPYIITTYKNIMGDGWGDDQFSEVQVDYAKKRRDDPANNPGTIINPQKPSEWDYYNATNWNDVVFDTSPVSTLNFNISQQRNKVGVFFSGEYIKQDGAIKIGDEKYKKYNIRSRVDYQLLKWAKLTSNISYSYSDYNTPQYAAAEGYGTLFFHVNKTNPLFPEYNPDGSYSYYGADVTSRLKDGGRSITNHGDLSASIGAQIDLIKGVWDVKADVTFKKQNWSEKAYNWDVYWGSGPGITDVPMDNNIPWVSEMSAPTSYTAVNVYSNFNKSFGNHNLSALVGFNQEVNIYDYSYAKRDGLINKSVPSLNMATGKNYETKGWSEDWAVRGAFLRLNYNYKNRYIAEINGRYDGSSRFPKDNRFAFFPSFSAGWVMSEESFFEPLKNVVPMFKLRGSYGMLGNQNVGAYDYLPSMNTFTTEQMLDGSFQMAINYPALVSGNLSWEKVNTANFGADINFWKNRIQTTFDIYRRDTKDMLVPSKTLPGVLGTAAPKINGADLKTTGWELGVSYRDSYKVLGKPFNIGVNFVLANNKSVITKYDNPTGSLDVAYYRGKVIGEMWGLHTAGFFKDAADVAALDQSEVTKWLGTRPIEAGDLKFVDLNGDHKITYGDWTTTDSGDFSVIGNSSPRLPYSIDLNLSWNNFDFRMYFQGVGKMDYYPAAYQHTFWGIYTGPWFNVLESNLDHWTPENPNAYFPRLKSYIAEASNNEAGHVQTKYMQDASYLRLKNLTVGYTLPDKVLKKIKLDKVRFYVSGENLALWTKLSENLDPENLTGDRYPIQQIFSFGVNLNF